MIRRAESGDFSDIEVLLMENDITPLGVAVAPENFLVLEHSGIAAVIGTG